MCLRPMVAEKKASSRLYFAPCIKKITEGYGARTGWVLNETFSARVNKSPAKFCFFFYHNFQHKWGLKLITCMLCALIKRATFIREGKGELKSLFLSCSCTKLFFYVYFNKFINLGIIMGEGKRLHHLLSNLTWVT